MSRSFKNTPILKSGGPKLRIWSKREANKSVRRHLKKYLDNTAVKGKWFRRVYNPWDIYDWISYCPKEERSFFLSEEDWSKYYYRK